MLFRSPSPSLIPTALDGYDGIKDGDGVIFCNFRSDRARELSSVFAKNDFKEFEKKTLNVQIASMTQYDKSIPIPVIFEKDNPTNTLAQVISDAGLSQLHTAETEKYAHVTFFFNGGVEEPFLNETRVLIPSPNVATYDLQPQMSAPKVGEAVRTAMKNQTDFIVVNFANGDMVGHTGVEAAAIKAIEAVDECVGKTVDAIKEVGGQMFICADHGNAEQLVDYETGAPFTAHTTNPVPFILVNADPSYDLREGGCLADIAPTLIELMGMEQPKEMTGKSLLIKK